MPPVVLINPFEVPEGQDEAFLAEWETAKAFMERQPDYIATRLHRSLVPNARFRFINMALRHEVARLIVWQPLTRIWVEGRRPCCLSAVEFRPAPTRTGQAPFSASGGPTPAA